MNNTVSPYWSKRQRRLPYVVDAIRMAMHVTAPDLATVKIIAKFVSDTMGLKRPISAKTILRDIEYLNQCGAKISGYRTTVDEPFDLNICTTYKLADPEWGLEAKAQPTDFLPALNDAAATCRSARHDETSDMLAKLRDFLVALQSKKEEIK